MAEPRQQRARRRAAVILRRAGGVGTAVVLAAVGLSAAAQMAFRVYPGEEWLPFELDLPRDYDKPSEWTLGRLMYPTVRSRSAQWQHGFTDWTIDYPKADRHIAEMVQRLSRIDARPVEQPVNLDDGDDVFNWPWLYAVEVGHWDLTDEQAAKLREYLLRGGFLMVDDFHGTLEWGQFLVGMKRVFPERPIVDIPPDDPIFETFWEIDDFSQIPGLRFTQTGLTYEVPSPDVSGESYGSKDPHWRAIYDDEGRIMVAICHNMDLGDSVEHSDRLDYPQEWSARGMRTFMNYIIYAMTH